MQAAEPAGVKLGESKNGHRVVQVAFKRLEGTLTVSALPIHEPSEVRLRLRLTRACQKACEPRLAADGALLSLVPKGGTQDNGKTFELALPAESLSTLASSAKATLRIGELNWAISNEDKQQLQEFILTCRQEQALAGEAPVATGTAPSDSL